MREIFALAEELGKKIAQNERAWLFLDYDGTLVDFAPTPDTIIPDAELIALITRLSKYRDALRIVILSGRSYKNIRALLPIEGVLEAGTYGIEFCTWDGEHVDLLDYDSERPKVDKVKEQWCALAEGRNGFYVEDKGYSIALHARDAADEDAREIIAAAEWAAQPALKTGTMHLLGGHKFIELAPRIADKSTSLDWLLARYPWPGADILYFGDDDKDEDAFLSVIEHGGIPVVVADEARQSNARYRLRSPREVRQWLQTLAAAIEEGSAVSRSQVR